MRERRFRFVGAAQNSNKYYNMFELGNGFFRAEWNREGSAPQKKEYPMRDWDKKANEKLRKGYTEVTALHVDDAVATEVDGIAGIKNPLVAALMRKLVSWSEKGADAAYLAKTSDVTQAMVDRAQSILYEMHRISDVSLFNEKMEELATVIPRRMANVRDYMAKTPADFYAVLSREQAILDNMAAEVKKRAALRPKTGAEGEKTLLETLGLVIDEADAKEVAILKKMLGGHAKDLVGAYRVTNEKKEAAYQAWKASHGATEHLLFHGTRRENAFSILSFGLLVAKAAYGMFGKAIYHADDADKSLGYADGGRWDSGWRTAERVLFVDKVAYASPLHLNAAQTDLDAATLKSRYRGQHDAVFAHAGPNLRKNEIMVYEDAQTAVAYILIMR